MCREGVVEKVGFWTTRDVRAFSARRAETKAFDLIRTDSYLSEHVVPELSQAAKIVIDEISILRSSPRREPEGFTFYVGGDAEIEWKELNVRN